MLIIKNALRDLLQLSKRSPSDPLPSNSPALLQHRQVLAVQLDVQQNAETCGSPLNVMDLKK